MGHSKNDVWVGLFVMLGVLALLFLALQSANLLALNWQTTYRVSAYFDNVGGLKTKSAVRSGGVLVGRVAEIGFDDERYQAMVALDLDARYHFPKDSSLKILTSGLLGDQYVGIEAGAAIDDLAAGDVITSTQSAVVLENVIGQFLYNSATKPGTSDNAARPGQSESTPNAAAVDAETKPGATDGGAKPATGSPAKAGTADSAVKGGSAGSR